MSKPPSEVRSALAGTCLEHARSVAHKARPYRRTVARQARNLHVASLLIAAALHSPLAAHADPANARVLADEIITTTTPSNNGSNPMWSAGAPLVVRENGNVWASISIHDPEEPPMCNTHWELWRKPVQGSWDLVRSGPAGSEREPCPLFLIEPGRLFLSVHPKIIERERQSNGEVTWFCQPAIAEFRIDDIDGEPALLQPEFEGRPEFNQHTYRSLAVDHGGGAFLFMTIDRRNNFNVTWRDNSGAWHPVKEPAFPIRSCYANMLLNGREGHVFAIGDIKEPVPEWREEKFRVLNREWDYAFRRLFYAWSPDLNSGGFSVPIEVDTVDDTAGWAYNLDMAFDANGRVHLLWVRHNIQYDFMRDRFFPGTPIVEEVRHAVVDKGRVLSTEVLSRREIDGSFRRSGVPAARFHELPDGRLLAVLNVEVARADGQYSRELLLQEMDLEARESPAAVRVEMERPPAGGWFFTNTRRGGSKPDGNIDILTAETSDGIISLRYIHVLVP